VHRGLRELQVTRINEAQLLVGCSIFAHRHEVSVDRAVAPETKRIYLHRGVLAFSHKADITVQHRRFDVERLILWHDDHELLCGGDDTADRVQFEFLHGTVDRRNQFLLNGDALRLDELLAYRARSLERHWQPTTNARLGPRLRGRYGNSGMS
jgi:hypothetical protein